MSASCPGPDDVAGVAHGILASVGCNSHDMALTAYGALTGPGSFLPAALTTCLTLYVALLGFGLLTGSPALRLTQVSMTGLKIGAVVALTLNWSVFQTLVFNVAEQAPFEVGQIFTKDAARGPGAGSEDPLTRLEAIHQELTDSANSLMAVQGQGGSGAPSPYQSGANQPSAAAQSLFGLAAILILSTVGLIALAMVAQSILVALGPAFMLFFLFDATRGLFVGWVRALAGVIIAPITSWGGLMVCMATLEPWIDRLADERLAHDIKLETISMLVTFVAIFAAVQAVMALGAVVIAGAFHLPRRSLSRAAEPGRTAYSQQLTTQSQFRDHRAEQLAHSMRTDQSHSQAQDSRRLEFASVGAGAPAEVAATGPRLGDSYRRPSPAGRPARPMASASTGGRP